MDIRAFEFARFVRTTNVRSRRSIVKRASRESADGVYDYKTDFYKRAREALKRLRGADCDFSELEKVVASASDKKRAQYQRVLGGFVAWAEPNRLVFSSPPKGRWVHGEVQVRVNPELCMVINGVRHVVKLNFNRDALTRGEVRVIHQLMHTVLDSQCDARTRMAVLDLAAGELHVSRGNSPRMQAVLEREAEEIEAVWTVVEDSTFG